MPKWIEFKKAKIHYKEFGEGRAVVLLHGFLESSSMWKHMAPELGKRNRVICIDLPGHGQSDCLGYIHSMEMMAECVKTVLHELNIRKAVIIGHSMGGFVALAFADLFPDAVKGLCLFHSSARADTPLKKSDRLRAIDLVKENHKSFVRNALPLLFRHKHRKALKDEISQLKKEALSMSPQGIIACLIGMRNRPSREVLLRFPPYPAKIIIGRRDPILPQEALMEQAEHSEQTEAVVLKDSGHMSHLEEPEESLFHIQAFVRKAWPL